MKKKIKSTLPRDLQKALEHFPEIVKKNKTENLKKQAFIEKTFGLLARKVHKEVHGKKTTR